MIEDSLGQLVCGGFQGTTVTRQAYELIVKYKVSTMILSRKNAHSVQQMSRLIRDLQFIAYSHANYKYPLAFAIDEEGGMLNSLFDPESLTQFPGAMALAATGDTELVYEVLKAIAIELKQIGFSIILGPVLDVVTKLSHQLVSVRAFGTTVDEVVKYGKACARGLRDGGLLTVGKHFPGIGNASVDSLLEVPMMADSLDEIKRLNLVPFAELIKENLLDGISAAGCGVPTISPDETHACLLPVLLTQLLRNEMGFQGFVISECLEMDALYHLIGLGQGVVLAVYAGCDLVMVCHDFKLQVEAIESIAKALANGTLDEDIINAALTRLEAVQRRLPSWDKLFPNGEQSEVQLFKDIHPDLWAKHQTLSQLAYRSSVTLIRDYEGVLPLTQFVGDEPVQNILLLTPLLNPVYPRRKEAPSDKKVLYTGEEVFQGFGELLALYQTDKSKKLNVLHTTYTANGLTALHELLIENSTAVIIVTSEALRNMYQIGIVKYVSILCGATPLSISQSKQRVLLAKPLVIVATLSPYDFFYNKSIGSAYLCCFDYTKNALTELAGVLMGAYTANGCIPGEKKFVVAKSKKRRSLSVTTPDRQHTKVRRAHPPKRRWLVDEFDLNRDWRGLLKLFKANLTVPHSDGFFRLLVLLLHLNTSAQKHFVVRNSSLNILYGVVLTWVEEIDASGATEIGKIGRIVYILVDKAKRLQLVGKNLHARAVRYLFKEAECTSIYLGSLFPLLEFAEESSMLSDPKAVIFFNNSGWDLSASSRLKQAHVVILKELSAWTVPQKIFRELTIVGVRFDICMQPDKLQALIERATSNTLDGGAGSSGDTPLNKAEQIERNRHTRYLYQEAINCMTGGSPYEVKIIIALEPTNQSVIGSIVLFTNKSSLARFYPFMEELGNGRKGQLVGGIVGPVIDPSYLNLTEIFKFGLICSGITYLRSNHSDLTSDRMEQCVMVDVIDDKLLAGVKDIGFEPLLVYHDYQDRVSDISMMVGE